MAMCQAKNGQSAKALQILRSVLRSQETRFGSDSEPCAQTNGVMGYLLLKVMDFDEALKSLRAVADWQGKRLPTTHPSVKMTNNLIQNVKECMSGKAPDWV